MRSFAVAVFIIAVSIIGISAQEKPAPAHKRYVDVKPTSAEAKKIEALIDRLVVPAFDAANQPASGPSVKSSSDEYWKRYPLAMDAFRELSRWKERAFPIIVSHMEDKRESINFRNHRIDNSVGAACYWNIYFQLQDRPRNYSKYGFARIGKDGKSHPQPYWVGTPFDETGGIKEWLDKNSELTYPEMQIKCLQWLLDREKLIGAPDAESYFLNILPLEIQILKRQKEIGMKVEPELSKKESILRKRDPRDVPADLLPAQ